MKRTGLGANLRRQEGSNLSLLRPGRIRRAFCVMLSDSLIVALLVQRPDLSAEFPVATRPFFRENFHEEVGSLAQWAQSILATQEVKVSYCCCQRHVFKEFFGKALPFLVQLLDFLEVAQGVKRGSRCVKSRFSDFLVCRWCHEP